MAISVSTLGTAQNKAGSSPWTPLSSLSIVADDRLIVVHAGDTDASAISVIHNNVIEESATGGTTGRDFYSNFWESQTFLTTSAYTIVGIELSLSKDGSPTGNINVGIYATSGGKPTGSALASGTIDASTLTTSAVLYTIALTSYALSDATTYAIVLSISGNDATDHPEWVIKSTADYGDGQRVFSQNSGVDWTADATEDFVFKIVSLIGETVALSRDVVATNAGNVVTSIWSGKVNVTGTAWYIRITNTSTAKAISAYKASGLDVSPLDKVASGTGSSTSPSSGATATLSQADELIIGAVGAEDEVDDMSGTWTTGAGYVSGNEQGTGTNGGGDASNIYIESAAEIVAATTAQTAAMTGLDNVDWAAAIATYKMAVAGAELEKDLADTIAIADSIVKAANLVKAEATLAIADILTTKAVGIGKADTVNITDSRSHVSAYKRSITDSIAIADSPIKAFDKVLAEAYLPITDAIVKTQNLIKADSIAMTDTLNTKAIGLGKVDTITIADSLAIVVAFKRSLSDSIAIADAISKAVGIPLGDAVTIADSFSKLLIFNITLVDTIAIADTNILAVGLNKADSLAIADALTLATGMPLADSLTITDALIKTSGFSLSDTIVLADDLSKTIQIPQVDTITIADVLTSKGFGIILADSITITDAQAKAIQIIEADTLTVADTIVKAFGITLADAIAIVDLFTYVYTPGVGLALTLALFDTLAITDLLTSQVDYHRSLSDTLIITDTIVTSTDYLRALADDIAIADAMYMQWGIPKRLTMARLTASRLASSRLMPSRLGKRRLSP